MNKKSHKRYLKKKNRFKRRPTTLWSILNKNSRTNLLKIRAHIIKENKKNDYTNNTIK